MSCCAPLPRWRARPPARRSRLAASALEALTSAGRELSNTGPPGVATGNVRFVGAVAWPRVTQRPTAGIEQAARAGTATSPIEPCSGSFRPASHGATCTTWSRASCPMSGKGLRPALCIATCRAFGGSIEQALPSAVSIELLHNAFLVHDDIEDGSLYRRNRATLYVEQGVPIAINVGDAMNVAQHRLADREHPRPGCRSRVPDLPRGAAPGPAIGRGPGAGARLDARQRLRADRGRLPAAWSSRRRAGTRASTPAASER